MIGRLDGVDAWLISLGDLARFIARSMRVPLSAVTLKLQGPRGFRAEVQYPWLRKVAPWHRARVERRIEAARGFLGAIGYSLEVAV